MSEKVGKGSPAPRSHAPVLLYDAGCALCEGSVRVVLRHDRRGTLRFAPLGGAFAREVLARHPRLAALDTVIWYEPSHGARGERVLVKSDAVLEVFAYLGGAWKLALAGRALPRRWRDGIYAFVSRHRHALFARGRRRPAPVGEGGRFLD
jgi:predicted DCC family thiol-disulfide oxidoreductase YuxK